MRLPTRTAAPLPGMQRSDRPTGRRKRLLRAVICLFALYLGLCLLLARETVRAKPQSLKEKPRDLHCEDIVFSSADGTRLRGWFVPPANGRAAGVVVCCHGVDSTRRAMVSAARILHGAGYAVVLFDFRA